MNDPLRKYRDKRNPAETNEPFSAEQDVRDRESTWIGRFVIHQHAATRLHFDLRLEIEGKLESFAVPKGLPSDPEHKHLAVHTEAHPLDYLFFEDVIPTGNYGAGAMIVWDTGYFTFNEADGSASLERGKIDVNLFGHKARGRWALIATGRRQVAKGLAGSHRKASQWLVIKKRDGTEAAGPESSSNRSVFSGLTVEELSRLGDLRAQWSDRARELTSRHPAPTGALVDEQLPLKPMACESADRPHRSARHIYELKLDGVRIVASKRGDQVQLHYRSGRCCGGDYEEVVRALRHLPVDRVVLDGEIVSFDAEGRPNFESLGARIHRGKDLASLRARREVPVTFLAFDLLQLGSADLRNVPLVERKKLLMDLVRGTGWVRALDHIVERGDALWQMVEERQLEGMVAKEMSSTYQLGPRATGSWLKMKRAQDDEFVVVGVSTSAGDRRGELRALTVASRGAEGWVCRGGVGSGFSNVERARLLRQLRELASEEPSVPMEQLKGASPVRPELVVKVRSAGFTAAGHLRAAVYLGVHETKRPEQCVAAPRDEWVERAAPPRSDGTSGPSETTATTSSVLRELELGSRVQLSNVDKVFFPEDGYTKGDLLAYAARIAPTMLPYLADRPVVLVRYPDGIEGKHFYQWRAPEGAPKWLRTCELRDDDDRQERGGKSAFLIDDVDVLLHIVNLGCIPLHVLASRIAARDECDFLTIDFDLGSRPFADGVRLALSLGELLDELNLPGRPKTSGQRGLHVLVPLGAGVHFDSAKLLCELLGRILVGRHPDLATMERRIEKREDKVYVDTGQTGRSRTIVAPYSVRAFPGARVSTPLRWEELHLALDPGSFTIRSVVERVQELGDPMADLLTLRPDLPRALATLERWTGRSERA